MDKLLHLKACFTEKSESDDWITIKGYANTVDKDRVGDVIEASAWTKGGLDDYVKNPIILAYHDRSQPIGTMIDHSVDAKGLEITAKIHKKAGNVYDFIKEGILKAFSVGIRVKEADYDTTTEIFVIKDLELHEVSVVSIPANQESLFQVSKCFDNEKDFDEFKAKYKQEPEPLTITPEKEEEFTMDLKELQAQLKANSDETVKAASAAAAQAVSATLAADKAAVIAAEKATAEAAAKEKHYIELGESGAQRLVNDLQVSMEKSLKDESAAFAEVITSLQSDIKSKDEEIRQILDERTRSNKMSFGDAESSRGLDADMREKAEAAFLIGLSTNKPAADTKVGQELIKAISNSSSSGAWASTEYWETEVSGSIQRDVTDRLVCAPLFQEIKLNTANLVMPVHPGFGDASWVGAAQIDDKTNTTLASPARNSTTTGDDLTVQMGEIILTTNKMAAKTFITDETEEDAVYAVLPLLRENLVEAHRRRTEEAFLNDDDGVSNATFNGLITQAADQSKVATSDAQQDGNPAGSTPSKDVLKLRRILGRRGLDMSQLTYIVSQEWYWRLLEDDLFADVSQVGGVAKKLTGQVGQLYGMPVVVSDMMPADADGSVVGCLVHRPSFLVPRQRGFNMQTDYYVEEQRRVIVSTQRFGFKPMWGEGVGVATLKYAANA